MKIFGVRTRRRGALTGTGLRGNNSMRKSTPSHRFRRGAALVWTAIILLLMIGFVGLSLDWGKAAIDAHQLQNAADAAALAGAMKVKQGYHDGSMSDPNGPFARARALALANRAWGGTPVDLHYNYANPEVFDPTVDVVVGRFFIDDRHFEPFNPADPNASPNALKAVTRHLKDWPVNAPLPLDFGPAFGQNTANVVREAIAINVGGGGAALICLDPDHPGIEIAGTTRLRVNEGRVPGEVFVDSLWEGTGPSDWAVFPTANSAPSMESGWCIDCAGMYVRGKVEPIVKEYFALAPNYYYPIVEHAPYMPDPLAWLPEVDPLPATGAAILVDDAGVPVPGPDPGGYTYLRDAGGNLLVNVTQPITHTQIGAYGKLIGGRRVLTLIPGYYSGGISVASSGAENNTIKMLPGVYALGGGPEPGGPPNLGKSGLHFNGGALDAEKVMVYLTHSTNGIYASVNLASYEFIKLTEYEYIPGDPEYYRSYAKPPMGAGMCIFQDRSSTRNANITAGGQGMNMTMGGTLYFHNLPDQDVLVEVSGGSGDTGIQLITDRVYLHGNGNITIRYDGRNFQPANQSLLVK
jgi:hypothetical protein